LFVVIGGRPFGWLRPIFLFFPPFNPQKKKAPVAVLVLAASKRGRGARPAKTIDNPILPPAAKKQHQVTYLYIFFYSFLFFM
jgi:hypothetical protein